MTPAALPALLLSLLCIFFVSPPLEAETFTRIDNEVRSLSSEDQKSIEKLTTTLESIAETDMEKSRALFIWISANIAYDTDAFFRGIAGPTDAEGTFNSRKSVCEGYSSLFAEIGTRMGLEVIIIHGYAKGYGYREGADPGGTNHAWNAVRIDGKWHLFDSTWGAGYVNGRDYIPHYNEFYFDTPPEEFIFTHFPDNPARQFLDTPISRSEFYSAMPRPTRISCLFPPGPG